MVRGWHRLRKAALRRDGGRCQLCGDRATEVDHVRPRAAGGSDALGNLQALCRVCHSRKTAGEARARREPKAAAEWRDALAARMAAAPAGYYLPPKPVGEQRGDDGGAQEHG